MRIHRTPDPENFNAFPWFFRLGTLGSVCYLLFANYQIQTDPEIQKAPPAKSTNSLSSPTAPIYSHPKANQKLVKLKPESLVELTLTIYGEDGKLMEEQKTLKGKLKELELPVGLMESLLATPVPESYPMVVITPKAWQKDHSQNPKIMTENGLLTIFVTFLSHNQ